MSDFGPSIFHCLVQNEEDPILLYTPASLLEKGI